MTTQEARDATQSSASENIGRCGSRLCLTVLAAIKQDPTRIRISKANSNAYEGWCERLADIARTYLPDARVADVERGFFQMIQDNKVAAAAAIL